MAQEIESSPATVDIPPGYLGTTPMKAKDLRKGDQVLNVWGTLDVIVRKPRLLKTTVRIDKAFGSVEYLDHDDPVHVLRKTP